jgi:thioredoxin-like negative regulator of GroEL
MFQRLALFSALTACGVLSVMAVTPPSLAQGETVIEMEEVIIEENVGGNNPDDGSELRPLNQDNSLLSVPGGRRLMAEANTAIGQEQYDVALDKLQQARKVFNQLSNFHLQLANSLSGISAPLFEEQRLAALETGQLRDEATYRLALVHRAKNEPELAVPLLVQIIRSQNPTTDLGRKSYQQLYELGFVTSPFTEASPTGASAAPKTPVVK